jgi:hypothetical protein
MEEKKKKPIKAFELGFTTSIWMTKRKKKPAMLG